MQPIIKPQIEYINTNTFKQAAQDIQEQLNNWIQSYEKKYKSTPTLEACNDNIHLINAKTNLPKSMKRNKPIDTHLIQMPSLINSIETQINPQIKPEENKFTLGLLTQISSRLTPSTLQRYIITLKDRESRNIYTNNDDTNPSIILRDPTLITSNIKNTKQRREDLTTKLEINQTETNALIKELYRYMGITNTTPQTIPIDLSNAQYSPEEEESIYHNKTKHI